MHKKKIGVDSIGNKKAHILGAGPIGLVCGWKLAENGYDVSIYERTIMWVVCVLVGSGMTLH